MVSADIQYMTGVEEQMKRVITWREGGREGGKGEGERKRGKKREGEGGNERKGEREGEGGKAREREGRHSGQRDW